MLGLVLSKPRIEGNEGMYSFKDDLHRYDLDAGKLLVPFFANKEYSFEVRALNGDVFETFRALSKVACSLELRNAFGNNFLVVATSYPKL